MNCKNCNQICQKWGTQENGQQRYHCRHCKKCQQQEYVYTSYKIQDKEITKLLCVGVGIRGMSVVLEISTNTVIKRIKQIADNIEKPAIPMDRISFELDELKTHILKKSNECWVAYAFC